MSESGIAARVAASLQSGQTRGPEIPAPTAQDRKVNTVIVQSVGIGTPLEELRRLFAQFNYTLTHVSENRTLQALFNVVGLVAVSVASVVELAFTITEFALYVFFGMIFHDSNADRGDHVYGNTVTALGKQVARACVRSFAFLGAFTGLANRPIRIFEEPSGPPPSE